MNKIVKEKRIRGVRRVRAKIFGTATRPRLSVFRSNKYLYLQLIDDENGKTLVAASTKELTGSKGTKTEEAGQTGRLLAKRALEAGIKTAIFDRRFYKYHGRVKAVTEGARSAGLSI